MRAPELEMDAAARTAERAARSRRRLLNAGSAVSLVALLVIAAGASTPLLTGVLDERARRSTEEELEILVDAAQGHFRDTGELPASVADLGRDPGTPGWDGPYLPGASADPRSWSGFERDGWSRPYHLGLGAERLRIQSAGGDARLGSEDDLSAGVDGSWLRREETLRRLRAIDLALVRYTERHGTADPLPADWPQVLERLVAEGLLPSRAGYASDAWGEPFVEWPRGVAPVVRVRSQRLGPSIRRAP